MIDFKVCRKEMEWGGRKLVLETGKVARQAEGAVLVTYGETEVLATVCAAKEVKADQDFFPLTVNYQEKYYATGKVPGGFMKREGKPSEREVLISRLIDRPIRPLFPDAFKNEVQVICTVLSHDQNTDSDIPAMIAASAALTISGIPFLGPIGAAKVGYIDGQFVLNPTLEQMPDTQLELSVAGTSEGVLMVESEANELSEETMLNAVMFGFESFQPVIKMINELKAEAGKPAWEAPAFPPEFDALYARIEKEFIGKYEDSYSPESAVDFLEQLLPMIEMTESTSNTSYMKDNQKDLEQGLIRRIHRELELIGISPKVVGYKYLTDAIMITIDGPTTNISQILGNKYKKSNSSVERAMQNAINRAWNSNDTETLLNCYTAHINPDRGMPTIKEFIYFYAEKITDGR